jgi:putative hemolysin
MSLAVSAAVALLLLLFAGSAFFSMSETAFIAVHRIKVRKLAESGDRKAALVDSMLDDPERFLSTVLVGNTIVNISAAAVAAYIAQSLGLPLATTLATIAVTLIVLIGCELVPKALAVHNPLGIARAVARPLRLVESILKPVIRAASAVTRGILRPFGVRGRRNPFITSDEIEMLVRMGVEGGGVAKYEEKLIAEVFEFTETDIHRVMTPRDKVHHLPKEARMWDAAQMCAKEGRTRIVIVDGDFDHVLGTVHSRDLLKYTDADLQRLPVTHHLRRVMPVPHDMSADRLLRRMQSEHCLMAVVQQDGSNLGIVTAEDLLEELVGEIQDEFDHGKAVKAA